MFGRIPNEIDSRDYNASLYLTKEKILSSSRVISRHWSVDKILNQGDTQHCVGFSMAHFCRCLPMKTLYEDADGHSIYYEAVEISGSEAKEIGTTIRNGAKALQQRGRIKHYALFNGSEKVSDIINWILTTGPISVGTNWYESMNHPNADGLVFPMGEIVGGHAYLINGVDKYTGLMEFVNSWGDAWGKSGTFKMSIADFTSLFSDGGDAIITVESMPSEIGIIEK